MEAAPPATRVCCKWNCCRTFLENNELTKECLRWRREWHFTSQRDQKLTLLSLHRDCLRTAVVEPAPTADAEDQNVEADVADVGGDHRESSEIVVDHRSSKVETRTYPFLGKLMCRRSWLILTGISAGRLVDARRCSSRGETDWAHKGFLRQKPCSAAMASTLWSIIHGLREVMPLKDVKFDDVRVPFSSKRVLFRMLADWYQDSVDNGRPCMPKRPHYSLFRQLLRSSDYGLNVVKFHRVVEMGRCALCCLLQHKCRAAKTPAARLLWQRLACRHQWLQRAQKTVYAVDRAKAAADYPRRTLYFAMDGGGGHDYVLPHLAGSDMEGPSKALTNIATNPMKVMNAVVHGDQRSHVILSPGAIVAGANHTCESISIVLSTAFEDHGDVPPEIALQMDNASPNHNILVMAFCGLYVLEEVCEVFKLRFELANHAHDIYDAFNAIHGRRVHASTFFSWDELVNLIKASHLSLPGGSADASGSTDTSSSPGISKAKPSSLMGHDVLVSNLWTLRDYWEWLAPGYYGTGERLRALSKGAFVCYDQLSAYHDFVIRKDGDASVGLWAKEYMSDPDSKLIYVGTLINRELATVVIGGKEPPLAKESQKAQKVDHDSQNLKDLLRVSKGSYREQFSEARLADAIAMCRRDWAHFDGRPGSLPAHRRLLPDQLGASLRSAGKRGSLGQHRWPQTLQWPDGDPRGSSGTALLGERPPPRPPRQHVHIRGDMCGVLRGSSVPLIARYGAQPRDIDDLLQRPPGLGGFVCTRSFQSTAMARGSEALQSASYWVWRVLRIYQTGDEFDGPVNGKSHAQSTCFEAHLYRLCSGKRYLPCWNRIYGSTFLYTDAEKARKAVKRALKYPSEIPDTKKRKRSPTSTGGNEKQHEKVPVWCMLRPDNLLGGGFFLTKQGRLPTFIQKYFDEHYVD